MVKSHEGIDEEIDDDDGSTREWTEEETGGVFSTSQ